MVKWLEDGLTSWSGKNCLTVQHEKGPLVKDARCKQKTQRTLTKKIKGELWFIFALNVFFLILEEMILPWIEILGGLSSEHHEVSWKLSKFLLVKMPFACAKWRYLCKYLPFSFIDGAVPTMLKKKMLMGAVGSAFGPMHLPELLHEAVDNRFQHLKIVKDHDTCLFFPALQTLSKWLGSFIWYYSLGILWVRLPTWE